MAKSPSVGLLPSLPAELARLVLEDLNREDLFNLRITCKAMNCYATSWVFRELHVRFEEQSLQSLCNIASHPILRKNVRKVTVGIDYFYNFDYEQFKKYVFSETNIGPTPSLMQPERAQRRDARRLNRTYYLKQCALEESGRDLAMMTQALRAFSSLVSIKLMDYQPLVDELEVPPLLRTESACRVDYTLTVPKHAVQIPRGKRQIGVLLQALSVSDRKIEELALHLDSVDITEDGVYGSLPEAFHSITSEALTGLKRLSLILSSTSPELLADPGTKLQEPPSTTILRAATQLECLSLQFTQRTIEPWNNYIQIPRVGQLRKLRVVGALLHEADFALFLRSSCQGLQNLTLGEVYVEEKSWDLIFDTIRSLPNLETIELYSFGHDIYRRDLRFLEKIDAQPLYDYLLRRREDNPWDSMCEVEWDQDLKEIPTLISRKLRQLTRKASKVGRGFEHDNWWAI